MRNRKSPEVETSSEQVMTAEEAAKFLKVSVNAIRRWSREEKLKGYRLGGTGDWRYLKQNVLDFLYGSRQ